MDHADSRDFRRFKARLQEEVRCDCINVNRRRPAFVIARADSSGQDTRRDHGLWAGNNHVLICADLVNLRHLRSHLPVFQSQTPGKPGRTGTIPQVGTTSTPITFDTVAMPRLRGGEAGLDGLGGTSVRLPGGAPPARC